MTRNSIVEKAMDFCHEHKIESFPVKIVELCESYGIKVFQEKLPDGVSGFIVVQEENFSHYNSNKVIVVNSNDPSPRRRFTIAHELGHYILHRNNESLYAHRDAGQRGMQEVEADIFASNILMPENLVHSAIDNFKALWGNVPPSMMCELIAHHFVVSFTAARVRLEQLRAF